MLITFLKDTAFGIVDTVNSAYNKAAETPQKLAEIAKDVEVRQLHFTTFIFQRSIQTP